MYPLYEHPRWNNSAQYEETHEYNTLCYRIYELAERISHLEEGISIRDNSNSADLPHPRADLSRAPQELRQLIGILPADHGIRMDISRKPHTHCAITQLKECTLTLQGLDAQRKPYTWYLRIDIFTKEGRDCCQAVCMYDSLRYQTPERQQAQSAIDTKYGGFSTDIQDCTRRVEFAEQVMDFADSLFEKGFDG